MTAKNQKEFFSSFFSLSRLCLLFLLLVAINRITADPDPSKLFLIAYDRECKEDRSVVGALVEAKALPKEEAAGFEQRLHAVVQSKREERLRVSPVVADTRIGRRLAELDWKDRRDHIISALDLLVHKQVRRLSETNETLSQASSYNPPFSVSHEYLEHVGMDIIDGSLLPDDEILKASRRLPCLKHLPQPNGVSYPARLPNDFNSNRQWYLNSSPTGIGAADAWACANGQKNGPVIAVIDTGCSNNPDLERNLCSSREKCFGFDAAYKKNPYNEEVAHGTAVSGIIAAVTNDKHGVPGVCWGCRIMCIKADVKGQFFTTTLVRALNFVLSKKNIIKIVNISVVGFSLSDAEVDAYGAIQKAGILVVAAAGNNNCNVDKTNSNECLDPETGKPRGGIAIPASLDFDNIITVGASDQNRYKSDHSNYGLRSVHLFAPGESIEALCNTKLEGCKTQFVTGTSIAAPLVSGSAALLIAHDSTLTYKKVKDLLMKSVWKAPALKPFCVSGGILDVGAAMEMLKQRKPCGRPSYDVLPSPKKDRTLEYYRQSFSFPRILPYM